MSTFAARLHQKIVEHSPLCVGIDPSAALLKSCNLPDTPDGAFEFGKRVLEAAEFRISLLKPQSAFFERFGSAGLQAVEELTTLARSREVLVLLDGKRGDIDTTGAAYAEGYFSSTTTLRVDAVTTHVYLGLAALDPFLDIAVRAEGGVFVVVRSSNPEGRELQTARLANGETVAQNLCREITARNRKQGEGLQYIGAVVGATCDDAAETVDALPQSFILAPGVGAQGATIQDVLKRMPSARGRVLPNVSRAILANGGSVSDIRTTIRSLQEQARGLL
ncbi:orotidine-5'-phosphate decarboxylase [Peristeroidobacter soli]|jgi:orotidine-5'-phosphate decarboxylase|uniref:orotidine-5'-phosphate decarboxylase n=1 Tax=Peristeroidobacter soli TaxID=2497877 RepID=UPI00101D2828|nr:orotidine-5'-phosphate decarboxylase [Peristeroidobacter soli]